MGKPCCRTCSNEGSQSDFCMPFVLFQFETFLNQINSSLVDSNMLVRCIVLSLDRFEGQTEDMKGADEKMNGGD